MNRIKLRTAFQTLTRLWRVVCWWYRYRQFRQSSAVVAFGLAVGIATLALFPFFTYGFPYTHDGENHLIRFANYAAAVREFSWPPRWAPFLFNHYGFPVFLYNYPLANIFATPGVILGLDVRWVYTMSMWVGVALGVWSTIMLVRQAKQSWQAAAWAGAAFAWSAPFASLWLIRGNIGEVLALSLFLFCWWALEFWEERARRARGQALAWGTLALGLSLLLISHNVMAMILVPLLGLRSLKTLQYQSVRWSWFALWFSVGLSGLWFWVPALGSLGWVVLQSDSLAQQAPAHIFTVEQLLWDPLRFGFSVPGLVDSFGMGLGSLGILGAVGAAAIALQRSRQLSLSWWFFAACAGVASLLATTPSLWLWSAFPALAIVQFPWRFLGIVAVLFPLVVAYFWQYYPTWWRAMLIVLLLPWLWTLTHFQPADRVRGEEGQYLLSPHTSLTRNENRPHTLPSESLPGWQPGPQYQGVGATTLSVQIWRGLTHQYQVQVDAPVTVVEPTVYFPGWKTTVNGHPLVVEASTDGLIQYQLAPQPQPQLVRTRFTMLWWWRLADVLSLGGVFLGGAYVWYLARR